MVDFDEKIRRQRQRGVRREFYRQSREEALLDVAYRGYTEKQRQLDMRLKIQQEWLDNQLEDR